MIKNILSIKAYFISIGVLTTFFGLYLIILGAILVSGEPLPTDTAGFNLSFSILVLIGVYCLYTSSKIFRSYNEKSARIVNNIFIFANIGVMGVLIRYLFGHYQIDIEFIDSLLALVIPLIIYKVNLILIKKHISDKTLIESD